MATADAGRLLRAGPRAAACVSGIFAEVRMDDFRGTPFLMDVRICAWDSSGCGDLIDCFAAPPMGEVDLVASFRNSLSGHGGSGGSVD